MATVTKQYWQCDRCGVTHDKAPRLPEKYSINVTQLLEWAGGPFFVWDEMCEKCNKTVAVQLRDMYKSANQDRENVSANR